MLQLTTDHPPFRIKDRGDVFNIDVKANNIQVDTVRPGQHLMINGTVYRVQGIDNWHAKAHMHNMIGILVFDAPLAH